MVGVAPGEDLSLGFEAAKCPGVDDTIAITLKVVPVRMRRLGNTAPAGLLHPHGVIGEHVKSLTEAAMSPESRLTAELPTYSLGLLLPASSWLTRVSALPG